MEKILPEWKNTEFSFQFLKIECGIKHVCNRSPFRGSGLIASRFFPLLLILLG